MDMSGVAAVRASRQVHGRRVTWHPGEVRGAEVAEDGDGHATAVRGLALLVTVADCVPVYLAGRAGEAVGILHAGWRGVAAGILARGVQVLGERAGLSPDDLVMHCGVSICGDCYEVGPEVHEALGTGNRRGTIDLRGVLSAQASQLGIGAVTVSPWCSAHDGDRFVSYRASGGQCGRMGSYIVMRGG
jgi:YfiH family protein